MVFGPQKSTSNKASRSVQALRSWPTGRQRHTDMHITPLQRSQRSHLMLCVLWWGIIMLISMELCRRQLRPFRNYGPPWGKPLDLTVHRTPATVSAVTHVRRIFFTGTIEDVIRTFNEWSRKQCAANKHQYNVCEIAFMFLIVYTGGYTSLSFGIWQAVCFARISASPTLTVNTLRQKNKTPNCCP